MSWQKITHDIRLFKDSCNVYAVTGSEGLLIIDAGTGAWLDHLDALPATPTALLLTHYFRGGGITDRTLVPGIFADRSSPQSVYSHLFLRLCSFPATGRCCKISSDLKKGRKAHTEFAVGR